jgi:hypothetical protein
MKKTVFILLAAVMVILPVSVSYANGDGTTLRLVGRELSPGIQFGNVYYGALFLGKIYSDDYMTDFGDFSVTLNRVNEGVEQCGQDTHILQFKLVMNFKDGSRLVLVMDDPYATASWDYNDPKCLNGCLFTGSSYYYYKDILEPPASLLACNEGSSALIASVGPMNLRKQWLGSSWRGIARTVNNAELNGWLVHTPLVFPAVFGTIVLD